VRRWPLIILLALAPVWLVGIFCRSAWTPDEPREADIVWRMSQQSDWTLPRLGDTPFLEKPPLTYWMSAMAIETLGDSPAAARVPNLFYAIIAALALGALAAAMESATTAVVAALVAGTAITAFRVGAWLAPDACLLAGNAIALLGAYLGFTRARGRPKAAGYTLMHLGAAVGFMAKSAPGWLVPALALLTLIAWERRWSELTRWELYVGLLLQGLLIGPWIFAVARMDHGMDALRTFFWHNVVGRFTKVSGPAALDYTTGHHNSPGKYFLELPIYLLPWTLLAVGAVRRALNRVRVPGPKGTPWRFAIAAIIPLLLLLSFAATARDIYAAPALLGFGLLVALWATEPGAGGEPRPARTGLDRFAIHATNVLVVLVAITVAIALLVLAGAAPDMSAVSLLISAVVVLAVTGIALWIAFYSQRSGDTLQGLAWTYAAYVAILTVGCLAIFPTIDRLQDLPSLAQRIHDDSRHAPLALLAPDETTLAMLDHSLRTPFTVLETDTDTVEHRVSAWLRAQGDNSHILVRLPGSGRGNLSRWISRFHPLPNPGDGVAQTLADKGIATIVHRYELPEGRRYALLSAPRRIQP